MRLAARYLVLAVFVVGALFPLYWVFVSSVKPNADVFKIPPTWTFSSVTGQLPPDPGDDEQFCWGHGLRPVRGKQHHHRHRHCHTELGARYTGGLRDHPLQGPMGGQVPVWQSWSAAWYRPPPCWSLCSSSSPRCILIDTQIAVIITLMCFGLPFVIWMMSGFFSELPHELDEAALVDGCSRIGSLFRVILPISVSGLVVTGFFVVLGGWNEFLIPLVLTENNAQPIAVAIQSYVAGFNVQWGPLFAASTLAFLPVLIMGALAQRYLARGFTSGAVKG